MSRMLPESVDLELVESPMALIFLAQEEPDDEEDEDEDEDEEDAGEDDGDSDGYSE